jgi:transposase
MHRLQLTDLQRNGCVALRNQGLSYQQIADELGIKSKSSVKLWIDRYNDTKTVKDAYRSGRPKITTERDIRSLIRMVRDDRKKSSQELAQEWYLQNGHAASPRTVRRTLQEQNYLWRPAAKKPRLTDFQKSQVIFQQPLQNTLQRILEVCYVQ